MPLKPPPPAPSQLPPSAPLAGTGPIPLPIAEEPVQEPVAQPKRVLVRAPQYPLWVGRQKTLVPVGHPVPLDLDDWVQTHIDAGGLEVVTL